ncbi:unnamed protein product [Psylliodes chrysocephalus]|uniref:Uncharacterized protein n=1 Tax=Psylliodes chrysocephalus TaxID=3402493 RepID=A0A9P0G9F3_9CUCU|nr:unnamed protein product [Psylliodes chrysocephala]
MESYLVKFIKTNRHNFENRVLTKKNGPPQSEINIVQECAIRNRKFKHPFKIEQYKKTSWLCGCDKQHALFCFPCLVFANNENTKSEGQKRVLGNYLILENLLLQRASNSATDQSHVRKKKNDLHYFNGLKSC